MELAGIEEGNGELFQGEGMFWIEILTILKFRKFMKENFENFAIKIL